MEFSKGTIEKLNYYVYRLIDPRNGQTFYVGKGKGNRVFKHVEAAIDYYDGVDPKEHDRSDDPNKIRTIKTIIESGLEVIHVIQRWNLTEKEAFEVESALIDCFPGLSNIQSGHGSKYGISNAKELERRLSAKPYEEPEFGYIIIKVQDWKYEQMVEKYGPQRARYEATRGCWKNKKPNLKKYPYVFSVTEGIVRDIYKVHEWHTSTERAPRIEFTGERVSKDLLEKYIGKQIPEIYCKKGMASPFLKSKNI